MFITPYLQQGVSLQRNHTFYKQRYMFSFDPTSPEAVNMLQP